MTSSGETPPREPSASSSAGAAALPPTERVAAADERLSLRQTLRLLSRASRGYWGVNLINFGDGIAYFGMLHLLMLFLQHNVGMATSSASVAVSTFTGVVTIGTFLGGGFISDWLGVRRALTLALLLILVGRIALVGAPGMDTATMTLAITWIALLVMGAGEAVIQPALYAGVKEYSDQRTATMGYALIYAVMNLGIAVESFASPLIREWMRERTGATDAAGGITGVYWLLVIVTLAMLVAHLSVFTRHVERTQRLAPPPQPAPSGPRPSALTRMRQLPLLDPRFLFFIFILLPVRTLFAHQWLTLPDYVMRCFPAEVGKLYEWIAGLNPLVIVVFVPLIAAWTRHVNVVTMMIIGTFVSAASTALLMTSPDLSLLVTYVIIFSLGEAAWSSRFLEYVADLAPSGHVGAYMGIATLPWFLAKTTTGLYSGTLLAHYVPQSGSQDPATLWTIYGAIAIISPIGLLLGRRWVQRGVPQTQQPVPKPDAG